MKTILGEMHPLSERGYFGYGNPDYRTIDAISKNLLIAGNKQSPPAMDATLAAAGRALLEISSSNNAPPVTSPLGAENVPVSPTESTHKKRSETGKMPKVQIPARHNLVLGRIASVDMTDGITCTPFALPTTDSNNGTTATTNKEATPVYAVMKVEFNAGLHSWDYDWVGNRRVKPFTVCIDEYIHRCH